MKKAVFFLAVMFSVCMFSQQTKPTLEKVGKMVKATYFHENGEVSQTGYMLKGKLHGDWLMFDTNGKKIAAGKYDNGKKTGKWFFWKEDILREVDFSDNRIVNVKDWSQSEVVSVNK
ncbi:MULTISPECIES: toxin-antitoxin system YwqK family antitoxin [Flagellimonas]|uniref:Nicotinic acid mononucleotide adenyltransferase n=1 Tax=Flagellimonas hadalis TaxID=2597517 RepID=A0A5N5IRY4_9FLAO|nr:nicotinic acid mononucleotide adenyltransferase [Allomuricauda hadalis]KAB5490977.1 nicotinic acid mononucleotide adenyltransferase [Allomuricauda hadalis]RUA14462.1 MAG: nicotinic acid mononucleotide adenyltransferase [Flavobacteriia bacterium]